MEDRHLYQMEAVSGEASPADVTQVSRDGGHAGQMDRHLVRKRGVRQTGPFEELLVSAYNL